MDGRGDSSTTTGYEMADTVSSSSTGTGCSPSYPVHVGTDASTNPNCCRNLFQQVSPPLGIEQSPRTTRKYLIDILPSGVRAKSILKWVRDIESSKIFLPVLRSRIRTGMPSSSPSADSK